MKEDQLFYLYCLTLKCTKYLQIFFFTVHPYLSVNNKANNPILQRLSLPLLSHSLSLHLPHLYLIHLSTHSIHLSIHLSLHPSIHLSLHLSINLSIYLSIYLYIHPSIQPSTYLFGKSCYLKHVIS